MTQLYRKQDFVLTALSLKTSGTLDLLLKKESNSLLIGLISCVKENLKSHKSCLWL